jgi:hypothetical protein
MILIAILLAGMGQGDEVAKLIDEKPVAVDISPQADDLKAALAEVAGKTIAAGPLNPYYVSRGELDPEYVFTNPADVVRALSAAVPHLPAALKPKVVEYLKREMAARPPWGDAPLRPGKGMASRNLHPLPAPDLPGKTPIRPGLGNLYALWLHAENTGDWETLRSNFKEISAFHGRHQGEAATSFGAMGGLVGMARIARKLGDKGAADRAAADLEKALAQADVRKMAAESSRRAGHGAAWQLEGDYFYGGFHYVDLPPEIARAIAGRPGLRKAVLEQTDRAALVFPHWFVSQASGFMRYYGESHAVTPLLGEMIFPVKAWVEDPPAAKVRVWAGAEDAPVGDLFFIKRLAAAIEAHGKRRWAKLEY